MVDTGNPGVVSRIVHEPVGVCGLITPWNYPLLQVSWKVAPCLAAGNTFVLKPSELTPHTAIHLMKLLDEAGLPAGVANLVLGDGANAGALLSEDPRVDLVSFTGGLATGKRIMATASDTVEEDRPRAGRQEPEHRLRRRRLDTALDFALTAVFLHSGQVCSAGARLVVEESMHDRLRRRPRRAGAAHPARRSVRREGRDRPADQCRAPRQGRGLRRRRPGRGRRAALRRQAARTTRRSPTASTTCRPCSTDCTSAMSVTQDESFGPVLTVETFTDEDDAVRIANDSIYGLAGAVWTERRRQGPASGGPAPHGHGVDQRLPPVRRPGRVGRLQAVRHRPRARARRASRSTARPSTSGTTSPPSRQHWFVGMMPRVRTRSGTT